MEDKTIEALGKLRKALETTERARGHLYSFHQLTGTADFELDDAIAALREAGHAEHANRVQRELLGRNVYRDGGRSRSSRSTTTCTTTCSATSSAPPATTWAVGSGTDWRSSSSATVRGSALPRTRTTERFARTGSDLPLAVHES